MTLQYILWWALGMSTGAGLMNNWWRVQFRRRCTEQDQLRAAMRSEIDGLAKLNQERYRQMREYLGMPYRAS